MQQSMLCIMYEVLVKYVCDDEMEMYLYVCGFYIYFSDIAFDMIHDGNNIFPVVSQCPRV